MSDFGFDSYALGAEDAAGHPHPLEIARELIATGKPRSALEVLSLHHDQLADDPEYLLICSEAWWATGDGLRAQQALLGAARLAPQDPRPLQLLGELLAERGEHERAERVLEKARVLELNVPEDEEPFEAESEDDLIALAEKQQRAERIVLTRRQIVIGAVSLLGAVILIFGIRWMTTPQAAAPSSQDPPPTVAAAAEANPIEPAVPEAPAPATVEPVAEAEPIPAELPEPPAVEVEPVIEVSGKAGVPSPTPEPSPAFASRKLESPRASAKSKPKPRAKAPIAAPPSQNEDATSTEAGTVAPDDAVMNAELASMGSEALTTRADSLYAQGHIGAAATYYRRALELDPDYAPALVGNGRGILRAEKYSEGMKNATRALQLARGVDARPGLEAEAIYQMGRVHLERGERDAARRLLRQSISLSGTPPEAWFYLGEALAADNSPAARAAYEKYLELVPKGHLSVRARRAIQ